MSDSDGGYSDDSGEDSDYRGDNVSYEDDKYITDSEASGDEKKRKRPTKTKAKAKAPPKKKSKVTNNNVSSYSPGSWVSKGSFKKTTVSSKKSEPTYNIAPAPKTFLSLANDLERKRSAPTLGTVQSSPASANGRLASLKPQPNMMSFFHKLDQFKFNGSNSSPNTRTGIPTVAPLTFSSPEKDSPAKPPPVRDNLLSPSKYVVSDSEKEEEPQKVTKKKRNKALVTSDDEGSPKPKPTSSSTSSATASVAKNLFPATNTANKENIKTPAANGSPVTPLSPTLSSSAAPLVKQLNGKATIQTKPATLMTKPSPTPAPTVKPDPPKIEDKAADKTSPKLNGHANGNKITAKVFEVISDDEEDVVITKSTTSKVEAKEAESDEDVVVTGVSSNNTSYQTEEDEDEFGVDAIIKSCESFSAQMLNVLQEWEKAGQNKEGGTGMVKTPTILHCPLRSYQLIGLNWLALLYEQRMCGILADEMGLGKTVQTISLLAHLLERKNNPGPHIVVVPSTTLANWAREFAKWCPSMNVITYYGSLKEREQQRIKIRGAKPGTYNVVLTTYNMAYGKIDRPFLKKFHWEYMILDEAHNLKNSESARYQHLLKIKTEFRLLLTGTPLQNNLSELWALLNFLMPSIFGSPKEADSIFQRLLESNLSQADLLSRMKKILSPFILRRIKSEVSHEIKPKIEQIETCPLAAEQKKLYTELLQSSKKMWNQRTAENKEAEKAKKTAKKKGRKKKGDDDIDDLDLEGVPQGASVGNLINNILMQMRKMANHPILCRSFYTQDQLVTIRDILKQSEPDFMEEDPEYLLSDLELYSDFELHNTCANSTLLSGLKLTDDQLFKSSGKLMRLEKLLKELKGNGCRVLLFSQMTKILDILEVFLEHLGYSFVRLDGQTPVNTRQDIIDSYNKDKTIFIFLLSTRAGGMGINLTSAETVIFYDISFNPQVDKQAEDRCHRLGQEKQVTVIKLIAEDTVDQYMLQLSEQKKELCDSMLEEGAFEEKGSKLEAKKLLKMFDSIFNNLSQD